MQLLLKEREKVKNVENGGFTKNNLYFFYFIGIKKDIFFLLRKLTTLNCLIFQLAMIFYA